MATTTARGGYGAPGAVPQARAELSPEAINLDDFYMNLEQIPPVAGGGGGGGGMAVATAQPPMQAAAPEWTPAERPIIRPPVSGGGTPGPGPARRTQVAAPRPADELGVEESEFDKPTYLRRGLYAPE